jgi:diaminopimelate decarboxylase
MLEPGRSLVGNTGLLLTTVLGIKETKDTKVK